MIWKFSKNPLLNSSDKSGWMVFEMSFKISLLIYSVIPYIVWNVLQIPHCVFFLSYLYTFACYRMRSRNVASGGFFDDSSSDDEYGRGMLGFSGSEVEELLCQGVKPWDSDAEDVLAALNGYYQLPYDQTLFLALEYTLTFQVYCFHFDFVLFCCYTYTRNYALCAIQFDVIWFNV